MANYYLDSNVVSDILRGEPEVIKNLKAVLDNNDNLFILSIVYYEVTRGLKAAGKTCKLKEFQKFHANAKQLNLDSDDLTTIKKAADIYVQLHNGQLIEDNDNFHCGNFNGQPLHARHVERSTLRARRRFELRQLEAA